MDKAAFKLIFFGLLFSTASGAAPAQVATNPPYTLEQSVIAGGGGTSANAANTFSVTGVIGQSVTDTSSASSFTVRSGFFTAAVRLGTTAATVRVSGRVTTADGRSVVNVLITMSDSSGAMRVATSGKSGYFTFTDVPAGDTYIFAAYGKRFTFSQNTQVRTVSEDAADVNFTADQTGGRRER